MLGYRRAAVSIPEQARLSVAFSRRHRFSILCEALGTDKLVNTDYYGFYWAIEDDPLCL